MKNKSYVQMQSVIGVVLLVTLSPFAYGQDLSLEKKQCVPAFEYIPFVGVAAKPEKSGSVSVGSYSRISPDGNYVLRSLSGSYLSAVTLMKLTPVGADAHGAMAIQTPLSVEAFPMMGTWRFLASPSGHYYRFKDIVEKGRGASSQFKAGITGFYATAAEFESTSGQTVFTMRSLSWPQGDSENGSQGQGQLQTKVSSFRLNPNGKYSLVSDSRSNYMCSNLRGSEGLIFTLPMISQDGKEFSAMPVFPSNKKSTMRIYRFGDNNKDCHLVQDLGVVTAKMIFGYKGAYFAKAPLVFKAVPSKAAGATGAYVYDRTLGQAIELVGAPLAVEALDFPGMTRDGRVVFAGKWRDCSSGTCKVVTGYVRVDPFQTSIFKAFKQKSDARIKSWPDCITLNDIESSVREFKAVTGM